MQIDDLLYGIKELASLRELELLDCYMTPEILSQILDAVSLNIETKDADVRINRLDFSHTTPTEFLNNDESREILLNFVKRHCDQDRMPELIVSGGNKGSTMDSWWKKDGKLRILYCDAEEN